VPLTDLQRTLLAELTSPPNDERYLAGGAAMHFAPHSTRYSDGLDFFHDSEARVASAFASDRGRLERAGYVVEVEQSLPGFVRAIVGKGEDTTRVDWAHDSAWRFMPLVRDPLGGLLLHPVDLAINKVLALAGRDEPRDFVDILFVHSRVVALPALCWAAVGKDPGFTPLSESDAFLRQRPAEESGCLYYAVREKRFVVPRAQASLAAQGIELHFGAPGGVLPRMADARIEDTDSQQHG
jgi:hypothetical protein